MRNEMEKRLAEMGLNPPVRRRSEVIARNLRRENGGAFGRLKERQRENRGDFRGS